MHHSIKFVGFLLVIPFMLFNACEQYTSKEYDIENPDMKACTLLADSLNDTLSTAGITQYDTTWTNATVSTIASAFLDSLQQDQMTVEVNEQHDYLVITDNTIDTSYAAIMTDFNRFVIFSDEVVDITIFDSNGTVLNATDTVMPLETVSGCMVEKDNQMVPRIKVRQAFSIQSDRVLLQIRKNDQTASAVFKMALLPNS